MIRFRLGISELFVHKKRYCQDAHVTLCPVCCEQEEDERHFLLYCPALYDLRVKYIIAHVREDIDPFVQLLSDSRTQVIRGVATYLYHAFKRRNEALIAQEHSNFLPDWADSVQSLISEVRSDFINIIRHFSLYRRNCVLNTSVQIACVPVCTIVMGRWPLQ